MTTPTTALYKSTNMFHVGALTLRCTNSNCVVSSNTNIAFHMYILLLLLLVYGEALRVEQKVDSATFTILL